MKKKEMKNGNIKSSYWIKKGKSKKVLKKICIKRVKGSIKHMRKKV